MKNLKLIALLIFMSCKNHTGSKAESIRSNGNGGSRNEDSGSKNEDVINVTKFGAFGSDDRDDTLAIQRAIDSSKGKILYFPNGYYRISSTHIYSHGLNIGLWVKHSITIRGESAEHTILTTEEPRMQILRILDTDDVEINSIGFRGIVHEMRDPNYGGILAAVSYPKKTANARELRNKNITVTNVIIRDASVDGIAIAGYSNVLVDNVRTENCRKVGIYVSFSDNVRIINSKSTRFGGLRVCKDSACTNSIITGAGYQISSNSNLIAENNIAEDGIGYGFLIDALGGNPYDKTNIGDKPFRNTIVRNIAKNIQNLESPVKSAGFIFTNINPDGNTETMISENQAQNTGTWSFYLHNHDQSMFTQNVGIASNRENMIVKATSKTSINSNYFYNSNIDNNYKGKNVVYIYSDSSEISYRENIITTSVSHTLPSFAKDQVLCESGCEKILVP